MGYKAIVREYDWNYIYGLFDPNTGECRYIGVSVRPYERYINHLNEKSKTWRVNWIKSLRARGEKPILFIFKKFPMGDDWDKIETAWIKYARDCNFRLTNCTDGGDGVRNLRGDSLERLRAAWIGRKHKPETLEKLRIARAGRKHTEEFKVMMREKMSARQITWGDKISKSIRKLSDEQVKEIRARLASGERQYKIAETYDVDKGTISNIKRRVCYGDVP